MKFYLDGIEVSQIRIREEQNSVVLYIDGKDKSVRLIRLKKDGDSK